MKSSSSATSDSEASACSNRDVMASVVVSRKSSSSVISDSEASPCSKEQNGFFIAEESTRSAEEFELESSLV